MKNSDNTFQNYKLKMEQGTLFLTHFPPNTEKFTMRLSALDGDSKSNKNVHRHGKVLIRPPSLNLDKSHNSRIS